MVYGGGTYIRESQRTSSLRGKTRFTHTQASSRLPGYTLCLMQPRFSKFLVHTGWRKITYKDNIIILTVERGPENKNDDSNM